MAKDTPAAAQGGTTTSDRTTDTTTADPAADQTSTPAAADATQSTPGDHDKSVTADANPSTEQVTQQGGDAVKSEGQRIREQARADAEKRDAPLTLDQALHEADPGIQYDDTGALVNQDGKRIAMAADSTDADVGWTVQHAGAHVDEGDRVYSTGGPASVPDQTVHPDELPDPLAAVRAGLLPQNAGVLNVDPEKFAGKKSLEA